MILFFPGASVIARALPTRFAPGRLSERPGGPRYRHFAGQGLPQFGMAARHSRQLALGRQQGGVSTALQIHHYTRELEDARFRLQYGKGISFYFSKFPIHLKFHIAFLWYNFFLAHRLVALLSGSASARQWCHTHLLGRWYVGRKCNLGSHLTTHLFLASWHSANRSASLYRRAHSGL